MKIFLAGLLLVVLSGCCTPKGPAKDWTGVARILPIVITTSDGETRWTNDQLAKGFKDANTYWTELGIQFKVAEPERVVNDKFYVQDSLAEFFSVMTESRRIAKARNMYPVYFVDLIRWSKEYGGMSTAANAPLGFQYGTMISAFVRRNSGGVIAHELGHAWNLRHTWSDKHKDTPGEDSSDCNDTIRCNLMSYCGGGLTCPPPPFFTPEQIAEVRAWALSSSRFHLLETDVAVQQAVLPLLDKFEPILDPVDEWLEKK